MEKQALVRQAQDMLAEGNINEAIKLVKGFLNQDNSYSVLLKEVLFIESLQNKTKQEFDLKTISFENAELNFGRARQGFLNLLEYIKTEDLSPDVLMSKAPSTSGISKKVLLVVGIPLTILTLAVLTLVLRSRSTTEVSKDCSVNFSKDATYKFLLLPFFNPNGAPLKTSGLIIERLEEFCNGIPALKNSEFQTCGDFEPESLLSFKDAEAKAKANGARMVIWGRTELGDDTTVVKTRYKYLGEIDTLQFTQIKREGEQQIATDKVLSIITSSGELTQDIENTLKLLVGLVAQLNKDTATATAVLKSALVTDSSANLTKYMILAENYLAQNKPAKAKAALDTCLVVNENYWLGRNNRANLRMDDGDFLGAIDDLNVALKNRPTDADMLIARGMAYMQSMQLYQAREDFNKAIQSKPSVEPKIKQTIEQNNIEIKRLEKILGPTKNKLLNGQNLTKEEYIKAAEASNQLGDKKTAETMINRGLAIDKNNPQLIATQVDILLKKGEKEKAETLLKSAEDKRLPRTEIAKHSKNIASFIQNVEKD